jgi:hypothetical protein
MEPGILKEVDKIGGDKIGIDQRGVPNAHRNNLANPFAKQRGVSKIQRNRWN